MASRQFEQRRRERMKRLQERRDEIDADIEKLREESPRVDLFGEPGESGVEFIEALAEKARSQRGDAGGSAGMGGGRATDVDAYGRPSNVKAKSKAEEEDKPVKSERRPAVPEATRRALENDGPVNTMDDAIMMDETVVRAPRVTPFEMAPAGPRASARLGEAIEQFEGGPKREMGMRAAPAPREMGGAGMAEEVAANELMQEIRTLTRMGGTAANERLLEIADDLERAERMPGPVGTTQGRPDRRTLERTVSGSIGGYRIPQIYINQILREFGRDFERVRAEETMGYGRGGRRSRGVRR